MQFYLIITKRQPHISWSKDCKDKYSMVQSYTFVTLFSVDIYLFLMSNAPEFRRGYIHNVKNMYINILLLILKENPSDCKTIKNTLAF